jgi:hypothetical protein
MLPLIGNLFKYHNRINRFRRLKNAPDNYDGECSPGDKGVDPGRCYNQPTYREIWCESATIQPDLDKWFGEDVYIAASGGFISTDYFSKNCKRLARTAATHDNIEKIVILYLRDFDKAGGEIAENLRRGFEYYCGLLDIQPDDPDFIWLSHQIRLKNTTLSKIQNKKIRFNWRRF